jgi:hypothetical protein
MRWKDASAEGRRRNDPPPASAGPGPGPAPAPPAECAALVPPAAGPPQSFRLETADPEHDVCQPGLSDGSGNLLLWIRHQFQPGGAVLSFFDASGVALARFRTDTLQVTAQLSGFEGASWVGSASQNSNVLLFDPAGTLIRASDRIAASLPRVAEDPLGGIVVAHLPDGVDVRAVQAYDEAARLRWTVPFELQRLVSLAVDRAGNTLLVLDGGGSSGPGSRTGLWIDHGGNRGAAFQLNGVAPGSLVDVFPRVGSGLFLREVRGAFDTAWIGQIDTLGETVAAAPAWLVARPGTQLHMARGGSAYAVLPVGGQVPSCSQRLEVVAPTGASCGVVDFPIAAGSCVTQPLAVGYDGTVIQQLPRELEIQFGGRSASCTWRWWAGLLR